MAEVSELFPREGMNALFYDEIEKLHQRQPMDPAELQRLMSMDYVGYIDRSLRSAGFRDPDLDPMVHDIVVKLITGALFRNVQGPFLARFAVSVKNSIITLAGKRQRVRRRYADHELETIPQRHAAPSPEDDLVGERPPPPWGPRSGSRRSGPDQPLLAIRRRALLTALASALACRSSTR